MRPSELETLRRIIGSRQEAWFLGADGAWCVTRLHRRRQRGTSVDVFSPPSPTPTLHLHQDAVEAAAATDWLATLAAHPDLEDGFLEAFRWWRSFRKSFEDAEQQTAQELQWVDRMASRRLEAWCVDGAGDWRVVDYRRRRSAGATVDVFWPSSALGEPWPVDAADAMVEAGNWKKILEGDVDRGPEFIQVFKTWRMTRKPEEEAAAQEQRRTEETLEALLATVPSFTLPQRHRLQLQLRGQAYKGLRTPEETQVLRGRRTTRCWNCHRFLDNYEEFECLGCGWILCKCGACGCGRLQVLCSCPMCGCRFREAENASSKPYCGWVCRSLAMEDYREYLASEEWAARRHLRLSHDAHTCKDCGQPATQVHHLTYERLGREQLNDLVSLCQRCHQIRHSDAFGRDGVSKVLVKLKA